jgi:hypothetical protein
MLSIHYHKNLDPIYQVIQILIQDHFFNLLIRQFHPLFFLSIEMIIIIMITDFIVFFIDILLWVYIIICKLCLNINEK